MCGWVRWAGHDAYGDAWEPLDNLANCEEAIASFERATGPAILCRAPPAAGSRQPDPCSPPTPPAAGFTVDLAPPGDRRAAPVGRTILYRWPQDGRQRGTRRRTPLPVRRVLARHGVHAAGVGAARHVLDAASESRGVGA